jgi:hypothetical protein
MIAVVTELKVVVPPGTTATPTLQALAVVGAALIPPLTQMTPLFQCPWPVVEVVLIYITWRTSDWTICPLVARAAEPVPVIIIPPKVKVVKEHHPSITPNRVVLVPTIQEYAATEPTPPEPVATTAVAARAA